MLMNRSLALLVMILCLLIASVLRWHALEQAPPGVHYDEGANGILAGDIGLRGERPIFIPSYTGKEVLFFYPAGLLMSLIGETTFTLRFTASLFGLLTIAATYWLGREMLADRRVAILAASLLAISFWHILFSRLGFRAITQPLLQALMLASLLRGIKRESRHWLIVSGIFLGLSAYTYLAVRIFPLLLLIGLLPLLPYAFRKRTSQLTLVAGIGALVLLPLAAYFISNPDAFWVRIGQVAPAGNPSATLLSSYIKSLGMLFVAGDPYWRFNLPGRALFNGLWGGFLLVGWLVLLWRWRSNWYDWQKSAILILIINPFIMILPTALATGEILPSNLRAIGLIPFIFYLPALGLIALLEQLANLFRRPDFPLSTRLQQLRLLRSYDVNYPVIATLILAVGGIMTTQTYFVDWAQRTDVYFETDADLSAIASYLDSELASDGTIFVSALHYRHPTLAFLSDRYDEVKWLPDSEALVIPAGTPATYIYPNNSPAPDWAVAYLPEPTIIRENQTGKTAFTVYHANQPLTEITANPLANFGHAVQLIDFAVNSTPAGASIPLTLIWRVTTPTPPPVSTFIHLEDEWGHRWSQVESNAYPTEQWQLGDTIIQRVNVPVPAGAPPNTYQLRIGLFNATTNERLPSLAEDGSYAGDSIYLEATVVAGEPPDMLPAPPRGQSEMLRPGLELLGYERATGPFDTGETIPLNLWWHATEDQPNLIIRLELIRQNNTGLALMDTRPVRESYPFPDWETHSFVIDTVNPTIPVSFPAGTYTLLLRLIDNNESVATSNLGLITINETTRLFDPPPFNTPYPATFGRDISLLGYELISNEQGHTLTLIWQALSQPTEDYTVFVHLLHPDGTCCYWQDDAMPQQNTYPTSRWIENEIIVDIYHIPPLTDSGNFPLEIGLYLPQNGLRLIITQPNSSETSDVLFLNPLIIP